MSGLRVLQREMLEVRISANATRRGQLSEDVVDHLETLRAEGLRARQKSFPACAIPGVGGVFDLFPENSAGPYHLSLSNCNSVVTVTRSSVVPSLRLDLYGFGLLSSGGFYSDPGLICDHFFDGDYETRVSGCELYIDFQCPGFVVPPPGWISTRSRCRTPFALNRDTGLYGTPSGGLEWRIYRMKTEASSRKVYGSGSNHTLYNPALPVYRLELHFHRALLRRMKLPGNRGDAGIDTLEDLQASLADLLGVALGDYHHEPWVRLSGPRSTTSLSRTTSSGWEDLRVAARAGLPSSGRRRVATVTTAARPGSRGLGRLEPLLGALRAPGRWPGIRGWRSPGSRSLEKSRQRSSRG